MTCIADLVACLERLAPPELAEEWDNVGLLIGDRAQPVASVLTCLTLTPDVAREAIERRASLVVTHHPVLFRAVKRLTADDPQGALLLDLIAARVAVYSPHTGYDSADEGINRQLAGLLGLTDVEPLRPAPGPSQCKIVCFVPREQVEKVQEAIWSAGAGVIGEYSKCSFVLDGAGSFLGSQAASPSVGQAGRLEHVAEARLEVICPQALVPEAVRRMCAAHPYEEPAYDVVPLQASPSHRGAGCVGTLIIPAPGQAAAVHSPPLQGRGRGGRSARLGDFLALVKAQLSLSHLQFTGELDRPINRVGICCGSGGELLDAAIGKRCDVFLTGEARFHTSLEARAAGIALVLAGHYATERPAMQRLAERLAKEFPNLDVFDSQAERDPIQFD